jgi:hypothetical protein
MKPAIGSGFFQLTTSFFARVADVQTLRDREIVDALAAMWADRVHQAEVAVQDGSELPSDVRMPMNYEALDST